jgi:hypothetical protein
VLCEDGGHVVVMINPSPIWDRHERGGLAGLQLGVSPCALLLKVASEQGNQLLGHRYSALAS